MAPVLGKHVSLRLYKKVALNEISSLVKHLVKFAKKLARVYSIVLHNADESVEGNSSGIIYPILYIRA